MTNKGFLLLFFVFIIHVEWSLGQKSTLSGTLKDGKSGEVLIGATLFVKELKTGTASNIYGFYSLTLPSGSYNLTFSYTGYLSKDTIVNLDKNIEINLELFPATKQLQEIQVSAEKTDQNISSSGMSSTMLKMETIKKIPALMGEVDVIKAIQLLPGVQTGGEGSAGFFVRGGGFDQNLILLDEAPVYNASHLMGFFSVFNQDAIRDAQLYKGGIPSQFGGRLSSVLDVRMKEGNSKKYVVSAGIGTLSSRLTIEGPIKKDKASFIVSGRRNYADIFLKFSSDKELKNSILYFYDLNAKVNYQINDHNKVFLSGYFGRDKFKVGDLFLLGWGNATATARWNHIFSSKLFSNLTLIYSNFNYVISVPTGTQAFEWTSKIIDGGLKYDLTLFSNPRNTIKFGYHSIFHTFKPAHVEPRDINTAMSEPIDFPNLYAWENAVYLSNEQRIGSRIELTYGLRYSFFTNIGPGGSYQFDSNYDTTGLKTFDKGSFYNTWHGFEPRFSGRISITDKDAFKASYNRTRQYIQVASVAANASPLDTWFPATPNVKPQIADQIAIGYFRNFKENMFEVSVEAYYKWLHNTLDFKDHADVFLNPLFEGELRRGSGKAMGLEVMIRKQTGKLNGWIAYTLSRIQRTTPGINNGQAYAASNDRPHNFTFVGTYAINNRWDVSATFIYYTGAPLTAPAGRFEYQGTQVPVFTERNGARMPDYHRLDIAATLYSKEKPKRKWKSNWVFGIYNVYNRKNAFMINFKQSETDPLKTEAVMTYYFVIIPSISYNIQF
ncbi:MAG: TonB-dependent receptor [Bacteroidia bacterium]|nr:TonB-dependent receptor [Bacteroidia bacterium]